MDVSNVSTVTAIQNATLFGNSLHQTSGDAGLLASTHANNYYTQNDMSANTTSTATAAAVAASAAGMTASSGSAISNNKRTYNDTLIDENAQHHFPEYQQAVEQYAISQHSPITAAAVAAAITAQSPINTSTQSQQMPPQPPQPPKPPQPLQQAPPQASPQTPPQVPPQAPPQAPPAQTPNGKRARTTKSKTNNANNVNNTNSTTLVKGPIVDLTKIGKKVDSTTSNGYDLLQSLSTKQQLQHEQKFEAENAKVCADTGLPIVNQLPYNKTLTSNLSKKHKLIVLSLAKYLKPSLLWCTFHRELIIDDKIVECANLQSILRTLVHRDFKRPPPKGFDQFVFALFFKQNYSPMLCDFHDSRDDILTCLARGGPAQMPSMSDILSIVSNVHKKTSDVGMIKQKLQLLCMTFTEYKCFERFIDDLINLYAKYSGQLPYSNSVVRRQKSNDMIFKILE